MAKWKKLSMALPAIAALIARMTAGRAGTAVLSDLLGSRAGAAAATRGAAAAGEAEGAAVAAINKGRDFKTAEEMLMRGRPQAPQGGVNFEGTFYKAGRYIPRAAVETAYLRSGGRSADVVRANADNSLGGPPPIQRSMLPGGGGGGDGAPPSAAGQEASAAMDQLGSGIAKVLLVLSPIAALGVLMTKVPSATERFARGILDTEAPLRRFNGSINAAYAELERGDLLRQRSRADATAGSTATLVGAVNQLGEDAKELRQAASTVLNLFATAVVYLGRIVNWLIEKNPIVQYILKVFQAIEAFLGAMNPVGNTWAAHLNDLASGLFSGKHGQGRNKKSGGP